jgi:hypothetical protein
LEADILIPIFVSGHPKALFQHLVDNDYNPIFYFSVSKPKVKKSWEVTILLSLIEFLQFTKERISEEITEAMVVVFPSINELRFFSEYTMMFRVYKKKDINKFIPSFVNLSIVQHLESDKLEKARGQDIEVLNNLIKEFKLLEKGL